MIKIQVQGYRHTTSKNIPRVQYQSFQFGKMHLTTCYAERVSSVGAYLNLPASHYYRMLQVSLEAFLGPYATSIMHCLIHPVFEVMFMMQPFVDSYSECYNITMMRLGRHFSTLFFCLRIGGIQPMILSIQQFALCRSSQCQQNVKTYNWRTN